MDKYLGVISIIAGKLIPALLLLIGGIIVVKIVTRVARKVLEKSALDVALHKFLMNIVRVVMYFILILIVFEAIGIDTKSMITMLGVCGGAIALSLKESLSNIAGGIVIIATKPFSNGDYVNIDGTEGNVEHVDMMVTTLVTADNKTVTIPNGTVSNSVVVNFTKANKRRVDCCFGIGYDDDIVLAKEILEETAKKCPQTLVEEGIVVGVIDHGASSVNIDLKVWALADDYWDVKYFLEENVKLAFDEAGISIPFDQIDVHMC